MRELNDEYVAKYLPSAQTFLRTWLPRLKENLTERLTRIWRRHSDSYRTLGSDGFKGDTGTKVTIVTESITKWVSDFFAVDNGSPGMN